MYLVMPLACVHHVSHVSDLVLAVITDVVHADQHRHNLPVLLEVQTLETQKHRGSGSGAAQREKQTPAKCFKQDAETHWVRLEGVDHVSYLI